MTKSKPIENWEEELKLYLTSTGDRRRTIYFIKTLLKQEIARIGEEIIGLEDKHTPNDTMSYGESYGFRNQLRSEQRKHLQEILKAL